MLGDYIVVNDATYSQKEAWRQINYLDTGNITENRISEFQHLIVGKDKIPSRARRKVQPGDIVYSMVRPNQRHYGLLKELPEKLLVSTGFAVIRGKEGLACTEFIYWFLAQDRIVEQLHTIAEHSTSAYPSIRPKDIEELKLNLPPLPEQRAIAHILGTLDDKIELNRRMNETLEEMARALFKSWFVNFDPVHAKAALKQPQRTLPFITPPLGGSRRASAPVGGLRRQYTRQTLQKARALRQAQTDAEGLLWHYLRGKRLGGYKFRRQQPIGPYIVDFACLSRKLLIEVDGGYHVQRKDYDERRDRFLRNEGYRVLRFWNNEVFEDCFGVLEKVYAALEGPPPPPGAATPPRGGSDGGGEGEQGKGWTRERARAYLDKMEPSIAALFPDHFVDSELGEIPAGWEVGCLADIAVAPRRGVDPTSLHDETPYIGLEHMPRRSVALTQWESAGKVTSSKSAFKKGEFLFGKLRPYFHKVGIAPVSGICSTDIIVVAPKASQWSSFVLASISSDEFVAYANQTSTGTKMPRTSWKTISEYRICLPSVHAVQAFQDIVQPMVDGIVANVHGSHALAALRDALLPKLISGEIRVNTQGAASEAIGEHQ